MTVHLRVASGLLPADLNGYSDPFVKLHLGPTVVRSTMQRKTLNPVFNEELRLPIAAAMDGSVASELRCEVWDADKIGVDDFLGECTIVLAEAFQGEQSVSLNESLADPHGKVDTSQRVTEKELQRRRRTRSSEYGQLHVELRFSEGDDC